MTDVTRRARHIVRQRHTSNHGTANPVDVTNSCVDADQVARNDGRPQPAEHHTSWPSVGTSPGITLQRTLTP